MSFVRAIYDFVLFLSLSLSRKATQFWTGCRPNGKKEKRTIAIAHSSCPCTIFYTAVSVTSTRRDILTMSQAPLSSDPSAEPPVPSNAVSPSETVALTTTTTTTSTTEEAPVEQTTTTAPSSNSTNKPRRIIRRRRREPEKPAVDPVLLDKLLRDSSLPSAYSFEIPKTITRIQALKATHIALQMPEGLLMYATVLADLYQRLVPILTQVSVLGDVTYGACCVDDLGAQALGAALLVHFGHSCLVPLQHTVVPVLYVFVEIQMDVPHMVACLQATVLAAASKQTKDTTTAAATLPHVYVLGTVQFRHALADARDMLQAAGYTVTIPQAKPLSPGEVLGCTSPELHHHAAHESTAVCFVADGRFHLESTLISNPHIDIFYLYDPYSKVLTEETYGHEEMKGLRQQAVTTATATGTTFGIILGTLGRQGNPAIVQRIQKALREAGKRHFLVLLSEISPCKLALLDASNKIDCWVQVACPRLSVDWGHFLSRKPVLSPYELFCSLEETVWRDAYPMDYYSMAGGPWSNYYDENKDRQLVAPAIAEKEA